MFRRASIAAWLACHVAVAADAQMGSVDVEVSSALYTKYIWNGFDRLETRGLEAGPVVQPLVEVAFAGSPLHARVGGSFVLGEQGELHETLYGVYVDRATSPLANLAFGYNFYDDRVVFQDLDTEADVHEIWGAITMRSTVGTRTRIISKYENPVADGFDSYWLFVGEIGYNVPLTPGRRRGRGRGSFALNLDASTAVIYTSAIAVQDVEVVDKGVSAWQIAVRADLKTGNVRISPSVHYQMSYKHAVNDKDPIWAGVNLAYLF